MPNIKLPQRRVGNFSETYFYFVLPLIHQDRFYLIDRGSHIVRFSIMTNHYNYRPLDRSRSEIRLIKLLPRGSTEKYKLIPACHVFHASLFANPKFVALSYVWGDATEPRLILADNLPIRVNKNLFEAMMALRPLNEHIVLWIDALCINQSDDGEKSWQVGIMANIYQQASKVVAWLGLADNSSDSAMDYLNTFGEEAETCGVDNGVELYRDIWQNLASDLSSPRDLSLSEIAIMTIAGKRSSFSRQKVNNLFFAISGWHDQDNLIPTAGMKRLFTRPWWGRIWVLQEIALPENGEFMCGTKRITRRRCSAALNAFLALWFVLTAKFSKEPQSLTPYQQGIIMNHFHHRPSVMLSSWNVYRHSKFPLAALLRATCVGSINLRRHGPHHLESTDPRDKIFALLSLAADRREIAKLGVVPDYTKPCKEIYTITMAALLQQGHISLLSFCQSPKLQSGLPSWVPDWSRSATNMLQDVQNDHITLDPEFNAAGAVPFSSRITVQKNNGVIAGISVLCYIYDQIQQVGSFPERTSAHEVPPLETFSWPKKWLVEILRLSYLNKEGYGSFSDRLRAAARTSIGGVGYDQDVRLARVNDDRYFEAIYLLQNSMGHTTNDRIKRGVKDLMANTASKDNLKSRVRAGLSSEIIGKSLGRLPFITNRGHLAISYDYVKRGDFIGLIIGAQVPFVLRRRFNGDYQVIGEAYVDGIMNGEAMKNSISNRINLV